MVNTKPKDNKLEFCLLRISEMVSAISLYERSGKIMDNCSINWVFKPSYGKYAISVSKKINAGKRAKKKLKAIEEALVVTAPSYKPLKKNRKTS